LGFFIAATKRWEEKNGREQSKNLREPTTKENKK